MSNFLMDQLSDEIRQFCSEHNLKLNTDLGQHFLIDQEILDSIVEAGNIDPNDHIVEIGPGIGVLTHELLRKGARVTAIELDRKLIPLIEEFVSYKLKAKSYQLSLIQENALHTSMPEEPYKVIANIPYHITSPLLRHVFLESDNNPTSLTLLIQREVAEKICDEDDASLLTILVAIFGKPRIIKHVPPSAFLPPPKVDSSVLQIDCYDEPIADKDTIEKIFTLTKHAFSQRRKMIRNTIGSLPNGNDLLDKAGINPERRPQTLKIDEWIKLAQEFPQK